MANPARLGADAWVAYPWIDGRPYDGSVADIMAAGELLGRMHAAGCDGAGMARFSWPEYSDKEVEQAAVNLLCRDGVPTLVDPDNAEYAPWLLDLALAVLLFHNEIENGPAGCSMTPSGRPSSRVGVLDADRRGRDRRLGQARATVFPARSGEHRRSPLPPSPVKET